MNEKRQLAEAYLKQDAEFAANVKDKEGLLQAIEKTSYEIRDGQFVNPKTNVAESAEQVIKLHSRPYLKTLGTGKYIGRFRDTRTTQQKETQKKETEALLKEWVSRRGYVVPDDMVRIWAGTLANHMLPAADGNGSFTLSNMVNGVPVDKHSPEDLFSFISEYVDRDKTRLNQLRVEAKIREDVIKLSGLTPEQYGKTENKAKVEEIEKLVSKEYYSQPVSFALPSVGREALLTDLKKEVAFNSGLNTVPETWTLNEKIQIEGVAENFIEAATREPINQLSQWKNERPPSLYQSLQKYEGLPYQEN